jgi:predicted nucleic acid-binding Zn ribbon protein
LSDPAGSPPRRLSESLGRYRTPLSLVLDVWRDVVGESVAGHAKPVAVRQGTLVVDVDDPVWATQLRWLGNDLLGKLAEAVGSPVAERVEIRVGRR